MGLWPECPAEAEKALFGFLRQASDLRRTQLNGSPAETKQRDAFGLVTVLCTLVLNLGGLVGMEFGKQIRSMRPGPLWLGILQTRHIDWS